MEETFTLTVEEAWTLSAFLQERMTGEESVAPGVGEIAHRLYHWCRENPSL